MKTTSEKQIKERIQKLIDSVEHDYSKYGDLSEWTRKETLKELRGIKRMISLPHTINMSSIKGTLRKLRGIRK